MKEMELSECPDEPGSSWPGGTAHRRCFAVPNHSDLPPHLGVPPKTTSVPLANNDLASRAVDTLKWVTTLPEGRINVTAKDTWLTLSGKVDCPSQKSAAEEAVRHLEGVEGITNLIEFGAPETEEVTRSS